MPELQFKSQNKQCGKMELKNQTETTVQLNIFGDIVSDEWGKWSDEDTCPQDIADFLKDLEEISEIEMHINSGGGSVFGGIAIYNMLKRSKAKITTYIDGIAASIASVIACAGDRIIIPKNGTFMIHKPTTRYFLESLNADDLRKDAETLDSCQKAIVQTYMEKVKDGVTEDKINELVNAETWLTGADAKEYFDFEVENEVQAAACTSSLFGTYKNAPKVKEDAKEPETVDEIAEKVIERLENKRREEQKEEQENLKKELLEDLDTFGI